MSDVIGRGLLKVVSMNASRLLVLIAVLVAALAQTGWAAEANVPPINEAQSEAALQLSVNRAALLEGKDEQTRVGAASLLLFGNSDEARAEILQALRNETHPQARAAVCRALTQAREDMRPVPNKQEFIEPLMDVLRTESDPGRAELAAQAMLMFSYDDIQKDIESLLTDPMASTTAHVNAVRVLMYEPDDRAIFKLLSLLGSSDSSLAGESRKALTLLGLEVPEDPNGIRELTAELQRRGPEAFLRNPLIMRNWLVSRETRIVELRANVTSWEQRYVAALRQLYAFQADEKAKGDFLAQQLGSPESAVKLWALEQLETLQKGTGTIRPSEQLESTLLGLVSNRDRQVRLRTASLLAVMWQLDSAQTLLDQLRVEEDADVRQQLFTTLGKVCQNASVPTSTVKVSNEIRKETLDLALTFLDQPDPARVRSGADVIRRLLEQNGLESEDVDRYLKALSERYQQVDPAANHSLRGDLLAAMAQLCAKSGWPTEVAGLYRPVFEEALSDQTDNVRQAAVDGLINIDKAAALRRLRVGFVDDPNPSIRNKIIVLAGDVGGSEDLEWLAHKIGQPDGGDAAWQAMLKVFPRVRPEVIDRWAAEFDAPNSEHELTAQQKTAFFLVVEQNARTVNDSERLRRAQIRLFALYAGSNDLTKASEYMDSLFATVSGSGDGADIGAQLLEMCLKAVPPHLDLASEVVAKYLSRNDLSPDNPVAVSLDHYLTEPPEGGDPNSLLARLHEIDVTQSEKRDEWRSLLGQWESFARARSASQTGTVSN